jgi:hypothetical protein
MPVKEMNRLMLKALDPVECFLTRITHRPEAAAENSAKTVPIMAFFEGCGDIKTNLSVVSIAYEVYVKTARLCSKLNQRIKRA